MIPVGARVALSTDTLPERNLWRNYHGTVVKITSATPARGSVGHHYGVKFPDGSIGRCTSADLGDIVAESAP